MSSVIQEVRDRIATLIGAPVDRVEIVPERDRLVVVISMPIRDVVRERDDPRRLVSLIHEITPFDRLVIKESGTPDVVVNVSEFVRFYGKETAHQNRAATVALLQKLEARCIALLPHVTGDAYVVTRDGKIVYSGCVPSEERVAELERIFASGIALKRYPGVTILPCDDDLVLVIFPSE